MTLFVGRGTSEKVTAESSFPTIEGPTPLTRLRPSIEPNGPKESRSATMRLASAGPMCLNPSISFSVATSRSTGPAGLGGAFCFFSRFGLRSPDLRAESAALICRSRADRAWASAGESDTLGSTHPGRGQLKRRAALCVQRELAYPTLAVARGLTSSKGRGPRRSLPSMLSGAKC